MKNNDSMIVLGLMSGTSTDGLDMAWVRFEEGHTEVSWQLLHSAMIPYDLLWQNRLLTAQSLNGNDLIKLHVDWALWAANQIHKKQNSLGIKADLIASHGHTVFHWPEQGYTLQIGCGATMHAKTGIPVVNDFRTADVAYGGQGAPLVPKGETDLFPNFTAWLNLGGFANIHSMQPSHHAFDICPLNIVLNELSRRLGMQYDKGGEIARQGKPIEKLLTQLNQLDYYHKPEPKSLGVEWANTIFWPVVNSYAKADTKNLLHTCIVHFAWQIANTLSATQSAQIMCTGGGVYNAFLLESICSCLSNNQKLHIPENTIIQYKEAIVFAYLGWLRWLNKINHFPQLTGCKKALSLGVLWV